MRNLVALAFISIASIARIAHAQPNVNPAAQQRYSFDSSSLGSQKLHDMPIRVAIEPLSMPVPATSTGGSSCNRRCAVIRGTAIGLGVGAVGGAFYGAHEDRTDNFGASAVGIDAAVFAVTGAFIGAITGAVWPLHSSKPIVTAIVPPTRFRSPLKTEWRVGAAARF